MSDLILMNFNQFLELIGFVTNKSKLQWSGSASLNMKVFIRLVHIFQGTINLQNCTQAAHTWLDDNDSGFQCRSRLEMFLGKFFCLSFVAAVCCLAFAASVAGGDIKEKSATYSHALPQTDSHLLLFTFSSSFFFSFSSFSTSSFSISSFSAWCFLLWLLITASPLLSKCKPLWLLASVLLLSLLFFYQPLICSTPLWFPSILWNCQNTVKIVNHSSGEW